MLFGDEKFEITTANFLMLQLLNPNLPGCYIGTPFMLIEPESLCTFVHQLQAPINSDLLANHYKPCHIQRLINKITKYIYSPQ